MAFELFSQSTDLLNQRVDLVILLGGLEEVRRDESGEGTEQCGARDHQHHGDDAAFRGDGVAVAVADRRDRRERPPQRVAGRADVRLGVILDIQHRERPEDHECDRDRDDRRECAVGAAAEEERGEDARGAERAQHANDAHEASPAQRVPHWDAGQEIDPAPAHELPLRLGLRETHAEVDEEHDADERVEEAEELGRRGRQRDDGLDEERDDDVEREEDHHELGEARAVVDAREGRVRHLCVPSVRSRMRRRLVRDGSRRNTAGASDSACFHAVSAAAGFPLRS